MIVPTPEALARFGADASALKAALSEALRETARVAELQSYEVPADFLIETEPFSAANGLLSGVGKILRPRLKEHYGEQLEQLLRRTGGGSRRRAARTARERREPAGARERDSGRTGRAGIDRASRSTPTTQFTDLGGDSLSALTFANLLRDVLGVDVPVGMIVGPTSDLRQIAAYIEAERESGSKRPTFASVHGAAPPRSAPATSRWTSSSTRPHWPLPPARSPT